jgi:hypothetical protein
MTCGPPLATSAPWPASSAVARATTPEGSGGSSGVGDIAGTTRDATVKEAMVAAIVKKSTDDATAVKKAIEEAAKKKAAEEAVAKNTAEEVATKKKAVVEAVKNMTKEEAAKKVADGGVAVKKATGDAATAGSGPSLAPSAGVKRADAPNGSTPLAKW